MEERMELLPNLEIPGGADRLERAIAKRAVRLGPEPSTRGIVEDAVVATHRHRGVEIGQSERRPRRTAREHRRGLEREEVDARIVAARDVGADVGLEEV